MRATEAQQRLALSPEQFGALVLAWLDELKLKPSRLVVLEEHLSAEALAERIHVDTSTAQRILACCHGRRKLSRKLVRVPASAVAAFLANKRLPARKKKDE